MPRQNERPTWPEGLVERVAAGDFVLFLGAGVSACAANTVGQSPPAWAQLLEQLLAQFVTGERARRIRRLLVAGAYLAVAEEIAYECKQGGRVDDFRAAIVNACDGPMTDPYLGRNVHELIAELNPRLIVTTNYDRILERQFSTGYQVKTYFDSDIASEIRRGKPVLLKLHGSANAPASTILTRRDFTRLRSDGAHAIETMQALLLTRMVLFLGYSVGDPDLQLILENLFGVQGQQAGHYLLARNSMPEFERELLREVYGIETLKYGGGTTGFEDSLQALVEAKRIVGLPLP